MSLSAFAKNSRRWLSANWKEAAWAVLPGIIACLAILYPFFLSSGEFIYLDWGGNMVSIDQVTHFFDYSLDNWTYFHWLPYYLIQVPFLLAFGTASSAVFSKLVFMSIFVMCSAGLYLLYREYGIKSKAAYLLSVAIMSFSPFVYERIMMGQFLVASSLFCLPVSLYLTKKFTDSPSFAKAWPIALSLTLLNYSLQGFALNTGVVAIFLLSNHLISGREKSRQLLAQYLPLAGIFLAFNLFWVIPCLLLPQNLFFSSIDSSQLAFFSMQQSAGFNTAIKSVLMAGSWREVGVIRAYTLLPAPFIFGFVALLFCLSLYALLKQPRNPLFVALMACWLVGLVFATGVSHPWTSGIFNFFYNHIPLFSGFRDSNKFVELITAAYAILAPIGVYLAFGEKAFTQKRTSAGHLAPSAAFLILLAAAIAYNYPAIGLSNQLHPISYPTEYNDVSSMIPQGQKAVLVPTGMYYTYYWSLAAGMDGRVSNPSARFPWLVVWSPMPLDIVGTLRGGAYDCINSLNATCLVRNGVNYALVDSCPLEPTDASWVSHDSSLSWQEGCLKLYKLPN
jgi:hypothetical protein